MNSEILFSLALGLQSPWQVKDMTFSSDESARSELHLHIDLMVDDYACYKALFTGEACIELACLAHARRKLYQTYRLR